MGRNQINYSDKKQPLHINWLAMYELLVMDKCFALYSNYGLISYDSTFLASF